VRLARFALDDGVAQLGVVVGDELAALGADAPDDLPAFLALGDQALVRAQAAAEAALARHRLADVRLLAPVGRPSKFLCVGLNYADHVAETGRELPSFPVVFAKLPSCVVGTGEAIVRPAVSDQVDWEGELAFVIGRHCRHVARDDAASVIAGYTIVNDVSVRDWQRRTPQWTLGKSFDTHGPMGPWLVTADELDPHAVAIRTLVNGVVRQESNTRQLIFDCATLVETISTVCTLEPGDVIATGTPGGVGGAMTPPTFLQPGDVVRVEIDGIGALENPVVAEAARAS
jgi:2-keto-4-pentenoate hydratase/2-oxohepta-3-ene-1,7-dioic acid hydratase in catechol pathway